MTALRSELQEALGLEAKEVVINQLTGHIIVKVRCGYLPPLSLSLPLEKSTSSRGRVSLAMQKCTVTSDCTI